MKIRSLFLRAMQDFTFSENFTPINRAFLYGDAVRVAFFVRDEAIIMAEESYFFLMASMRKMRMNIPLTYTLEFFQSIIQKEITDFQFANGIIEFLAFREDESPLEKAKVSYVLKRNKLNDVLEIQGSYELDILKEIHVNTSLLSSIRTHCPEDVYASIYAKENELDEVILLNPSKRIARAISGNLLFLQDGKIKVPKQSEGALISPLMENFVTFLSKQNLAEVEEVEMAAFESQKAQEIVLISDTKGLFSIRKIRNKEFSFEQFANWIEHWRESFEI